MHEMRWGTDTRPPKSWNFFTNPSVLEFFNHHSTESKKHENVNLKKNVYNITSNKWKTQIK